MATPRKKHPRPSYRQHTEAAVDNDIRHSISQSGPFWDFLTEERLQENFGQTEWERGIIEGARRFAGRLQDIILLDDHKQ